MVKARRRKGVRVREARPPTGQTNESGSIDFVSDELRWAAIPAADVRR